MTAPGRVPTWVLSWLRDPLIHFLVIGGVLFAAYGLLVRDGNDPRRITVSRDALINFAQYRANTFQFDVLDQALDELTAAERQALVDRGTMSFGNALSRDSNFCSRTTMNQRMSGGTN
jgi:hypothetical protein